MKENKYDNDVFFEKYGHMNRSVEGLTAAGEWGTLKKLLPNFSGLEVLDLGCGYGWHCIHAAKNGAKRVVGVDLSKKMLDVARAKTEFSCVEYQCAAMEDFVVSDQLFDVVLSSLALHYVSEYENVVKMIHSALKTGGQFIFSCEHPVFTAQGPQDWVYDKEGKIAHFPVDNYFIEGKREATFLGEKVVKYHRTLTSYLNTLLDEGFAIEAIVEPQPSKEHLESVLGMVDELRRPMMLIVSARKI